MVEDKVDDKDAKPLEGIELCFWSPTGSLCPSQWMGVDRRGREIYVRYRWGRLQVWINAEVVWEQTIGGRFDGFMDDETMLEHTGVDPTRQCEHTDIPTFDIFQLGLPECSLCEDTGRVDVDPLPEWYGLTALRNRESALSQLCEKFPDMFECE